MVSRVTPAAKSESKMRVWASAGTLPCLPWSVRVSRTAVSSPVLLECRVAPQQRVILDNGSAHHDELSFKESGNHTPATHNFVLAHASAEGGSIRGVQDQHVWWKYGSRGELSVLSVGS